MSNGRKVSPQYTMAEAKASLGAMDRQLLRLFPTEDLRKLAALTRARDKLQHQIDAVIGK